VIIWGSWPDWVTATFTSLAFVVAAVSYARSVKVRREAQARLVYSKLIAVSHHGPNALLELLPNSALMGVSGGGTELVLPAAPDQKTMERTLVPATQLTAVIHNGSSELIGPAKLQVVNVGDNTLYDNFAAVVDAIDPDSEFVVVFTFPNPHFPGEPALGTTVIFRDASGSWWRRHRSEPIESAHDDPENSAPTAAMRAQYAANARAMGLQPSPEPHVRLRTKWHRYWRVRRGATP
jgi:hypothetical protein